MKKTLCILLTVLLTVALVSCDSAQTPAQSSSANKPTTVQLTTSNITDYLSIEGIYGQTTRETQFGMSIGHSNFTFSINPVVPGDFYNTKIKLQVSLTWGWNVSSSDPAYSDSDGYLTTTITIPTHGSKEETHDLIATIGYLNHDNQSVKIEVVSVEGTFMPRT